MKTLLLPVLIMLTGCATAAEPVTVKWAKSGATYEDFLKDRYACMTEARSSVSSGYADRNVASARSGEIVRADFYFACLAARGYQQDPNGFGPPAGGAVSAR